MFCKKTPLQTPLGELNYTAVSKCLAGYFFGGDGRGSSGGEKERGEKGKRVTAHQKFKAKQCHSSIITEKK